MREHLCSHMATVHEREKFKECTSRRLCEDNESFLKIQMSFINAQKRWTE